MEFIKRQDRYDAISADGQLVAYIEKNYIGTHGHSAGWSHYTFCDKLNKFVRADCIFLERKDTPCVFRNVKAFQDYYNGGNYNG